MSDLAWNHSSSSALKALVWPFEWSQNLFLFKKKIWQIFQQLSSNILAHALSFTFGKGSIWALFTHWQFYQKDLFRVGGVFKLLYCQYISKLVFVLKYCRHFWLGNIFKSWTGTSPKLSSFEKVPNSKYLNGKITHMWTGLKSMSKMSLAFSPKHQIFVVTGIRESRWTRRY